MCRGYTHISSQHIEGDLRRSNLLDASSTTLINSMRNTETKYHKFQAKVPPPPHRPKSKNTKSQWTMSGDGKKEIKSYEML